MSEHPHPITDVLRLLDPVDVREVEERTDGASRAAFAERIMTTSDGPAASAAGARGRGGASVPPPRHRRRWVRVPAAVAAVAALLAVVVGGWPTGTPPVVADWSATPQELTAEERAAFDGWCRTVADGDALAGAQLVLADQRGRMIVGTYVVEDGRTSQCVRYGRVAAEGGGEAVHVGSVTSSVDALAPEGAGPFEAVREGGAFTYPPERVASARVHGLVTDEVARVTGTLDDGRSFDAALEDGRFHGWWPQECPSLWRPGWWVPDRFRSDDPRDACAPDLRSLEAYDADGARLDRWTR